MFLEQRLEFIDSLPAFPPSDELIITPRIMALETPHDPDKSTASVMPDTINAFLPGVSKQAIDDVNLCKLVMQNAASKLFPEDHQLFEWYKYYVNGLSNIGWAIQNKNMQEITIEKIGLTMDQVALQVVAGLLTPGAAGILANIGQQAVNATKNDPDAIKIFEKNTQLGKQAKFDIAPVWVEDGRPNMVLNCISLDARESTRGILFWKSTRRSTSIKSGAVRTYLDENVFAALRAELYGKYTEAGKKFIKDLPDF